jgi:hypothetical protein
MSSSLLCVLLAVTLGFVPLVSQALTSPMAHQLTIGSISSGVQSHDVVYSGIANQLTFSMESEMVVDSKSDTLSADDALAGLENMFASRMHPNRFVVPSDYLSRVRRIESPQVAVPSEGYDPAFVSFNPVKLTYTLWPTGIDDTLNIEGVLKEAALHDEPMTVHLEAGTFYLSRDIQVAGFEGVFRGAGQDQTIIQPKVESGFTFPKASGDGPLGGAPFLLAFYCAEDAVNTIDDPYSISMSDMTFRPIGEVEWWGSHGSGNIRNYFAGAVYVLGKWTGVDDPFEVTYIDTRFERLTIEAEYDPNHYAHWGYSCINGIQVYGEAFPVLAPTGDYLIKYIKPTIGSHSINDCTISNIVFSCSFVRYYDSNIIVIGNTFTDGSIAVDGEDLSNSTFEILNNVCQRIGCASLFQGQLAFWGYDLGPIPGTEPSVSSMRVINNRIECKVPYWAGVEVWDVMGLEIGVGGVNLVCQGNEISSSPDITEPVWYAIACPGVQRAQICGNYFFGEFVGGIAQGYVWGVDSIGWIVTGNHFGCTKSNQPCELHLGHSIIWIVSSSQWHVSGNRYYNVEADVADIWLDSESHDNTVTILSTAIVVLDEGVNNQILVEQYVFDGLSPPLTEDWSSVFAICSVLPVKFQLFDCQGVPVTTASATLDFAAVDSVGTVSAFQPAQSSGSANVQNNFRVTGQEYHFNLDTDWCVGTYLLRITLDDGQQFRVLITLK